MVLLGKLVDDLGADGRTVLAITHDMDFCAEHFDRVIVLEDGGISWDGPVDRWLAQAADTAGQAYELPQMTRLGRRLGWEGSVSTVTGFLEHLAPGTGPAPLVSTAP